MERKAEEPTWHLLTSAPPVFEQRELGQSTRNDDVFVVGWLVVCPLDSLDLWGPPKEGNFVRVGWECCTQPGGLVEYAVDRAEGVGEWEATKIRLGGENPSISIMDVFDPPIHGREVGKCVEAAQGRHLRELLRPWDDRHFLAGDSDTTDEDIKATCNKGGVEAGRRRHGQYRRAHCRNGFGQFLTNRWSNGSNLVNPEEFVE